jgi:hypothetical protein
MGKNFFGAGEARKCFSVIPSNEQPAYLAQVPFNEEVLTFCKDTHILVAVFPLSILDIRRLAPKLFLFQDWYVDEPFAASRGELGWQLIRKTPVPNSLGKTLAEQLALLDEDEKIPTARAVVYTVIGHWKNTGERLFKNVYVRCAELDSVGYRVHVGDFGADGLRVDYSWDDLRFSYLGVSASWIQLGTGRPPARLVDTGSVFCPRLKLKSSKTKKRLIRFSNCR